MTFTSSLSLDLMLIVLSGLPVAGKTTIGRALVAQLSLDLRKIRLEKCSAPPSAAAPPSFRLTMLKSG
jgi:hypothetical protein